MSVKITKNAQIPVCNWVNSYTGSSESLVRHLTNLKVYAIITLTNKTGGWKNEKSANLEVRGGHPSEYFLEVLDFSN